MYYNRQYLTFWVRSFQFSKYYNVLPCLNDIFEIFFFILLTSNLLAERK